MTPQEAVDKVKDGQYALYLDNNDVKTLNIVLINAFRNKATRSDYGPDKFFYGNQVESTWRAGANNMFVDPKFVIRVSDIGANAPQITLNIGSVNRLPGNGHPTYEVNTIDDLYQIATEENLERIMLDLKATFTQLLSMEAKTASKAKLSLKSFTWIDDWSEQDKEDHEKQR